MAQGIIKNIDITARQVYTLEVTICDSRTTTLQCVAYPVFDKPFTAQSHPEASGNDGRIRYISGPFPFYTDVVEHQPNEALDCYDTENPLSASRVGVRYPQPAQSLVVSSVEGSDGTYLVTVPYGLTFDPNDKADEAAYQKTLWTVGDPSWCPQPRKYAYEVLTVIPGTTTQVFLGGGYLNMLIKPTPEKQTTSPTVCSAEAF